MDRGSVNRATRSVTSRFTLRSRRRRVAPGGPLNVLIFLLLNAGAALAALLVAYATDAYTRTSRFLLFTLCGYLIVIHSTVLAAGVSGWLSVGGCAAVLAIVLAIAAWSARRVAHRRESFVDERPRFTPLTLFCPIVAIVTGGIWAWPHVIEATRLWIWDDYTYHLVYPAMWLRDRAIAVVSPEHAFTMQAWYPLSASVVSTWFMLPFAGSRADALAWVSLTGVLYAAVITCGAAELLARLGCRRGAWAMPVVLFATSQRIGIMASSFSDADLAHAAALFAAVVLATPRAHEEEPRELRVDAAYAALLVGIALGVKVSASPAVVVVLAMFLWRARGEWNARGRIVLIFGLGVLLTGGYWYVRNVLHTGNPVYPAAFLFWPGAAFPQTTLREYAQHYGVLRAVGDALTVYLNWPPLHGWVAIVGLIGLAGWRVRRLMTRPQAVFAGGALAMTAITLLLLPFTPYSAGNGMTFTTGIVHWDSMRYVALLPILGWTAVGFLIDAGAGAPLARTAIAVVLILGALFVSEIPWWGIALVAVAAVMVSSLKSRTTMPVLSARARRAVAAACVMVVAGGIAGLHRTKAEATATALYREPLYGSAAAVLDRQPVGTRVAVYGDQWIYPVFGARHHLVPVRLDGNGRVATTPIGDAMKPGPLTVDAYTFRRNLATAYIGVVVVVQMPHPGRSAEWPEQAGALENMRGTRLIYRDRAVGIWKLGD
jgi:hypothetical protein